MNPMDLFNGREQVLFGPYLMDENTFITINSINQWLRQLGREIWEII